MSRLIIISPFNDLVGAIPLFHPLWTRPIEVALVVVTDNPGGLGNGHFWDLVRNLLEKIGGDYSIFQLIVTNVSVIWEICRKL